MEWVLWLGIIATVLLVTAWYVFYNESSTLARSGRTVCYEGHVYYTPSADEPDERPEY